MATFIVTTLNNSGVGSFRAAWDAALARADQDDLATITFSVGGTIVLSSNFDRAVGSKKNVKINGGSAPSRVTLDCSVIPTIEGPDEPPIFDILGVSFTLESLDFLNPPYSAQKFRELSAINNTCRDVTVTNTDNRGDSGGGLLAMFGARGSLFEDCVVRGANRLRGFMTGSKVTVPRITEAVLRRCVVEDVRGGFDCVTWARVTLDNCRATNCSAYNLQVQNDGIIDAVDCIFEEAHGGDHGITIQGSRVNLLRCTVRNASGAGPRDGVKVANRVFNGIDKRGIFKAEESTITGNTGAGVRVIKSPGVIQPLCDLGGGELSSVGRNIIRLNDGLEVLNQTGVLVEAENNTWTHSTLADVLAFDVSSNVDVTPLFVDPSPEIGVAFQADAVEDTAFQLDILSRQAEVSWAELEVPDVPITGGDPAFQSNAVEDTAFQLASVVGSVLEAFQRNAVEDTAFQTVFTDRRAELSWAEVEVPTAARRAELSWAEVEVPNQPIPLQGGIIAVPTDTLTLSMAYSLIREIIAPTLSQRLGSGAMQRRRLYERPVYAFRVRAIEMSKLEQEDFYSFAAFRQGDIPFWFGGGEWGTITNPILVGFGDGTHTQFFLPNRNILTGPTVKVNGVDRAVTLTASSGLITFVDPPANEAKITATYTCRYKVVFGDADEVLVSEELFAFQLFNDQGIRLVELVP